MQRKFICLIGIAALAWAQAVNAGVEPIIAPVPSWVKPLTLPDANNANKFPLHSRSSRGNG